MLKDDLKVLDNEYLDITDGMINVCVGVTVEESELSRIHDEVDYFVCNIYKVDSDALVWLNSEFQTEFDEFDEFYAVRINSRFSDLKTFDTLEDAIKHATSELEWFLCDYDLSKEVEFDYSGEEEYRSIYEEILKKYKEMN